MKTREVTPYDTSQFYLGPSTMDQESQPSISIDCITSQTSLNDVASPIAAECNRSMIEMDEFLHTSTSDILEGGPIIPMTHQNSSNDQPSSDDGFLAFGTIRLTRDVGTVDTQTKDQTVKMIGKYRDEVYPGPHISSALKKGWIRIEDIGDIAETSESRVRVYIMPEDVDRGSRGSLRDFRKVVKWLLDFVDCSIDAWIGLKLSRGHHRTYGSMTEDQDESLFYIFNTLASPQPDVHSMQHSNYGRQAVYEALSNEILGLKTPLYPYQRRSVAAMAQREAEPAKICDARKRKFADIHGRAMYIDPLEGVLMKDPPLYTEPQGGILAETMGYGKTLICIALILATRGHYPKIPEGRVDQFDYPARQKVGSLLAMAARRAKHEGVPWKSEFGALKAQGFHFDGILEELGKYERAYAEPIFMPTTPGRKGKRESYNVVRLCSATLIIVPTNLLLQWQQEIEKHVEAGSLDVLVIDQSSKVVPTWQELLKHDVVLMTKPRFEQEYRDDDLNQGKTRRGEARYYSPLTKVRWLRVICDEGHGFAGSSSRTNAMAMLDKMYIERRWVVSGTPSSTLYGVEVNLAATSSSSLDLVEVDGGAGVGGSGRRQSISKALNKRRASTTHENEAKDLERLRLIVVNFLRLQPWANQRGSDNANWKRYLSPTSSQHDNGVSSSALREVLQTLIIRHRIEDIDCDLQLPALHSKVVYLKPSYHDKLALNMFSLVLASNFVTSEREDEDYMFHPKNRRKFDLLINNLRQATFHWVGFTEEQVRETVKVSNEYLDKNIDLISDEDGILLTEGILNGQRALQDRSWLAFSKLHEIGVYLDEFPDHARAAWALDGRDQNPTLLGTVQAREARKFINERTSRMVDDVSSGLAGMGIKVMKAAHDKAAEEQEQKSKARASEGEMQSIGAVEEPKLKAVPLSSSTKQRTTKIKLLVNGSVTPLKRKQTLISSDVADNTQAYSVYQQLPTSSVAVPQSVITGFTSAKLTYLMNQLLLHSPESKSIVFYSHPNTAFWIAEALELLHISHRIYASTLSMAQRNSYLQLFNTDESIRVLLMDLKQAGQGLHIASANRVYIIAPIWEDGVQSQAIKRAHRIGQTRDVYVETLVLQGTFEEELIRRRQEIDKDPQKASDSTNEQEMDSVEAAASLPSTPAASTQQSEPTKSTNPNKTPTKQQLTKPKQKSQSILDDRHMVRVLKNMKFLKFTTEEDEPGNTKCRIAKLDLVPYHKRMLFGGNSVAERNAGDDLDKTADNNDSNGRITDLFNQKRKNGHVRFNESQKNVYDVETGNDTDIINKNTVRNFPSENDHDGNARPDKRVRII